MITEFYKERKLKGIKVPVDIRTSGIMLRKRVYPTQFTEKALWEVAERLVSLRADGYFADWDVAKDNIDEQASVNEELIKEAKQLKDDEEFEVFGIRFRMLENSYSTSPKVKILDDIDESLFVYYVNPTSLALNLMQRKIANERGNDLLGYSY